LESNILYLMGGTKKAEALMRGARHPRRIDARKARSTCTDMWQF